jgi:DNA-binding Xre family transcriptional regulator
MPLTEVEPKVPREELNRQLQNQINELLISHKEGMTDEVLADKLDIERAAYSKMKNGDPKSMNAINVEKLCRNLGMTGEEKDQLSMTFLEALLGRKVNFEPKLLSPEARLQRALNEIRELGHRVLMNSEVCKEHQILRTFTALMMNPNLHKQVDSLIEFADKLRPLDGIHPPQKSEDEQALEALEKARREKLDQEELPKHPLKSDVDLI